jgi:TRAP-type transport system small permease protein
VPEDLPGPAAKLLATFNYAMIALVGYIFVWYGYEYAVLGMTRYSFGLRAPMVFLYAAMPITGVFLFLFLVERLISLWSGEERRP